MNEDDVETPLGEQIDSGTEEEDANMDFSDLDDQILDDSPDEEVVSSDEEDIPDPPEEYSEIDE